ncbi:MAG: polar amino acid transport system permease protein [Pseudonocardiales bacterium]|jgi:polar amino acid transport system permease protein|nr:ectoine/hydroxyectoine transporter permease subunit EhuD [Pseudonocardia sp.]MDT7583384.1 polar amino acid transport system permease protein [Pseudonocardiales bacterium]MDT7675358.1 polar amino acid transport system permease protein [Pseudonocardiales bacterium]MDT7681018.1 polar amino acid transport system permease protein [Pseudonocardiales bacterium]MDT7752089.1 polar amino acid transport system permease protein [Pseudonocardiales bacterium]
MPVWDWGYAFQVLPQLLRALLVTLEITVLGSVVALVLGLVIAVVRRAKVPVLDQVLWAVVEFIRSTPLLVQVFFLYFALPRFGVTLSALTVGVIGLGVHYATYTSEVYRAGIDAVPRGQWEAATALSLSPGRTWTGVILPQAIPRVLPALGNYVISMFKEVPLLLAISVIEVVNKAKELGSATFRFTEPYTIAGLLFLVLSYPASILIRRLERRRAAV